jgi:hypothetical protein
MATPNDVLTLFVQANAGPNPKALAIARAAAKATPALHEPQVQKALGTAKGVSRRAPKMPAAWAGYQKALRDMGRLPSKRVQRAAADVFKARAQVERLKAHRLADRLRRMRGRSRAPRRGTCPRTESRRGTPAPTRAGPAESEPEPPGVSHPPTWRQTAGMGP